MINIKISLQFELKLKLQLILDFNFSSQTIFIRFKTSLISPILKRTSWHYSAKCRI